MKRSLQSLQDCCHLELKRYHCLEQKCATVFAVITLLLVGLALLVVMSHGVIFTPQSAFEWLALLLIVLGSFSLACAWGHCLMALCSHCELSDLIHLIKADSLDKERESPVQDLIEEDCESVDQLSRVIEEKRHNLAMAFDEIRLGGWILALLAALMVSLQLAG